MIKSSKYFSLILALILLIGCESENFNSPGKTILISPENVQICETGVSLEKISTHLFLGQAAFVFSPETHSQVLLETIDL